MAKTTKRLDWIAKWTTIYNAMSTIQLNHQLDSLARAKRWDGYTKNQKKKVQLITATLVRQCKMRELINPTQPSDDFMKQSFADLSRTGVSASIRHYNPQTQQFEIRKIEQEDMVTWDDIRPVTTGRISSTQPNIQELPQLLKPRFSNGHEN